MTLECIVQVCTTRELWPPSILQLSSFTHTPFQIKRSFFFYLIIHSFENLRSIFDLWRWSTQMRLHSFKLFLWIFSHFLRYIIKCQIHKVVAYRQSFKTVNNQISLYSLEFLKVVAQKLLSRMCPDYDFRAILSFYLWTRVYQKQAAYITFYVIT